MKVKEAIDIVDNTDLYSVFMADDIIKGEVVASHQDDDEHRWYIIATRVYKLEDGYVGVRGPYSSKSEMQFWEDIAADCGGVHAFEVEPVPSTYYKKKQ